MQDPYLQPGTSDSNNYFDLPDAGEDKLDEGDYCRRCGAMLTECDEEMDACTQCGFRLRGKE